MTKRPDKDGSRIAQLKYPGGFSFSVCFSYTSQSFLDSYFVAVGREATKEIQKDCPIFFFVPALGGVVFNFESANAREVISCKEDKPLTPTTAAATIANLFATTFRWGKNMRKIEKPKRFQKTKSADLCSIDPWVICPGQPAVDRLPSA